MCSAECKNKNIMKAKEYLELLEAEKAVVKALHIGCVSYCYECNKPYDDKDREHGMCHKCWQTIIEE